MSELDQLRALLGLSAQDVVVEDDRVPAPATGIGHGLVSAGWERQSLDEAVSAILRQPGYAEDPALAQAHGLQTLARWHGDPQLVLLGDAPVAIHAGRVAHSDELGWVLDTRAERSVVVLQPGGADGAAMYVCGERGVLTFGHVTYAIPPFTFAAEPQLELPGLESMLDRLGVKRWLRDEVHRRARSASPLDRTAAVGLTARLALGALDAPGKLFDALVAGAPDPIDELRVWARALTPALVAHLLAAALDDAAALGDVIESLSGVLLEEEAAARALAVTVRIDRDDLESVAFVLRTAEPAISLVDALRALDRRAIAHLTTFDLVADADTDPPLLAEVSAAQPDAWWGTAWSD